MAKVCGHHRVHRGLPCPHFYTAIVHFLPCSRACSKHALLFSRKQKGTEVTREVGPTGLLQADHALQQKGPCHSSGSSWRGRRQSRRLRSRQEILAVGGL